MNEQELRSRFAERIAPRIERRGAGGSDSPLLLLVGGQPGAGKTRAMARLVAAYDERLYPVVGDDLRQHHPDYDRLVVDDPLRMPEVTAAASGAWVQMSMEYAREHRISVAVEGTFRRPEIPEGAIERFAAAGYRVHVAALGVPAWQSRLSTVGRFVQDHAAGRAARWTPLEAHEGGYAGTPVVLDAAIRDDRVSRVSVLDRDGVRFDGVRGRDDLEGGYAGTPVVLDAAIRDDRVSRVSVLDRDGVRFDGVRGRDDLVVAATVLQECRNRRPGVAEARDWLANHSEWVRYLQREFPERAGEVREALSVDAGMVLDAAARSGQRRLSRPPREDPPRVRRPPMPSRDIER